MEEMEMRGAILIPVLMLGACSMGEASENEGQRGTRNFQVGAFDKISLTGSPNVIVTVGGAPSVRADGDSRLIEKLEVKVENGVLRIGYKKGNWSLGWRKGHGPVTVHVSAPSLSGAEVAGSGDMKIDKIEGGDFAGEIAGSGEIQLASLRARKASFSIAGSGGVTATSAPPGFRSGAPTCRSPAPAMSRPGRPRAPTSTSWARATWSSPAAPNAASTRWVPATSAAGSATRIKSGMTWRTLIDR
jgi:hypothetical protein